MLARVFCLAAAVSIADAFSPVGAPMAGLLFGAASRGERDTVGCLSVRMGSKDGSLVGRRDALLGASAMIVAGAPFAAAAEEGGKQESLGYDIPSELESWKGWNKQRVFKRAGREFEIEQRFADNRQNGMTVYEGNEAMTEYMESLGREYFQGKSVMELGTGTGLGSMVAFSLGADVVTATDRNPKVLDLAAANFKRNIKDVADRKLNTRTLLWGSDQCGGGEEYQAKLGFCWKDVAGRRPDKKFDVIIGSDLTYSEGVLPDLIKTLKDFMHKDSEVILVWCEPKLFTWNTDVMSRLNQGILTFDRYFDAKVIMSNKTYNTHPDTTIVKLKLSGTKPGCPDLNDGKPGC